MLSPLQPIQVLHFGIIIPYLCCQVVSEQKNFKKVHTSKIVWRNDTEKDYGLIFEPIVFLLSYQFFQFVQQRLVIGTVGKKQVIIRGGQYII